MFSVFINPRNSVPSTDLHPDKIKLDRLVNDCHNMIHHRNTLLRRESTAVCQLCAAFHERLKLLLTQAISRV